MYYWATPTLGTFLRLCFGSEKYWLQYIPALAGLIWFFFYWRMHKVSWIWEQQIIMLIFISLMTNFYTWPSDYLMILPAVMQAAVWLNPGTRSSLYKMAYSFLFHDKRSRIGVHIFSVLSLVHLDAVCFMGWIFILLKKQLISNIIGKDILRENICHGQNRLMG